MDDTNLKLIIISDGTGETASRMARAAMTQFNRLDIYFTRYKNVRSREQIDAIFTEAAIHHDMIVYTLVSDELREYTKEVSRKKRVRSVDLMGPILSEFSNYFHSTPSNQPGLLHQVNDEYFERVGAIEFTLNHDDGKNLVDLPAADIVLVGISRTSKTPLSIYLSMRGLKVINIPLVLGVEVPNELKDIDQKKIVGLTIDPQSLITIRKHRLTQLGAGSDRGDYADDSKVGQEVEWANQIFAKNKRWPVFDVTDKALEEVAAEIMKLLSMRKANLFKQKGRDE